MRSTHRASLTVFATAMLHFAFPAHGADSQPLFSARDPSSGKWGFISRSGNLAIGYHFDRIYDGFSDGLAIVCAEGKWGVIDEAASFVVRPLYDEILPFSCGLAVAAKGDTWHNRAWGYIDRKGDVAIPLQYCFATPFSEGVAYVTSCRGDGRRGYIDTKGTWIIDLPSGHHGFPFHNGMARCGIEHATEKRISRYGFIDRSGKLVIPADFDYAGDFSEGLAPVVFDLKTEDDLARGFGKGGFIDTTGKLVINIGTNYHPVSYIDGFHEGLAHIRRKSDGRWGFIDQRGRLAIEPQFEDHWPPVHLPFSEGLAVVWHEGQEGYIAKDGKWVIAPAYDEASSFSHGLARVTLNEGTGYIDKTGKYVWGPKGGYRYEGGDGVTQARAVRIVGASSREQGVNAEYRWLKKRHPNHEVKRQSLLRHDGKDYDVIEITTKDKQSLTIYFDISEFMRLQ